MSQPFADCSLSDFAHEITLATRAVVSPGTSLNAASTVAAQTDYEKHTIAQLKDLCAQRGLFPPERAKKAVYIEILKNSPAASTVSAQTDYEKHTRAAVSPGTSLNAASTVAAQTDYEKHTIAQLKDLCAQRGLFPPEKAKKAVYIEILKNSPAASTVSAQTDYEKHTIAQLKDLCAQRGLFRPEKATKAVYIEILKNSAAVDAAALQDDDSSAVDNWHIGSSIDIEEILNAEHLPQYIDLSKSIEDDNCVRPIQKVQLAALGSRLQSNTSILHLNFFGNNIGPDGMRELQHPIGALTGLLQLELGGACVCTYDCFGFCIL
jgi:hypothetical protein